MKNETTDQYKARIKEIANDIINYMSGIQKSKLESLFTEVNKSASELIESLDKKLEEIITSQKRLYFSFTLDTQCDFLRWHAYAIEEKKSDYSNTVRELESKLSTKTLKECLTDEHHLFAKIHLLLIESKITFQPENSNFDIYRLQHDLEQYIKEIDTQTNLAKQKHIELWDVFVNFSNIYHYIAKQLNNISELLEKFTQLILPEKTIYDHNSAPADSFKNARKDSFVRKAKLGKIKFTDLLFPGGKVKPSDINQGQIGDCYLLSVAQSLAQNNPQKIKDIFLNADEIDLTSDAPQKLRMRFYSVNESSYKYNTWIYTPKERLTIQLDPTKIFKKGNYSFRKALWPRYIEMAYAIMRSEGQYKNYAETLNGGDDYKSMVTLTGEKSVYKQLKFSYSNQLTREQINLFRKIENTLNNKQLVGCSRKGSKDFSYFLTYNESNLTQSGDITSFYDHHTYSILKLYKDKRENYTYITLRNPHGYRQTIAVIDFLNFFDSITYQKASKNSSPKSAINNEFKYHKDYRISMHLSPYLYENIKHYIDDCKKFTFKSSDDLTACVKNVKNLYEKYLDSLCKNSQEKFNTDFGIIHKAYTENKKLPAFSKSPDECYKELIAMSKKEYNDYKKAFLKLKMKIKSMIYVAENVEYSLQKRMGVNIDLEHPINRNNEKDYLDELLAEIRKDYTNP